MSVILGYKTTNKIILAADNKLTDINGTSVSNNLQKIIIVNDQLAISFCGNHAVQQMFSSKLELTQEKSKYNIEDALLDINALYLYLNINKIQNQNILLTSSCFIIGGKNKAGNFIIQAVSYVNGELSNNETELILFPPIDLDMATCSNIFIKYLHTDFDHCMEKTIKDISKSSKVVSPSGDIWILNTTTGNSEIQHFC